MDKLVKIGNVMNVTQAPSIYGIRGEHEGVVEYCCSSRQTIRFVGPSITRSRLSGWPSIRRPAQWAMVSIRRRVNSATKFGKFVGIVETCGDDKFSQFRDVDRRPYYELSTARSLEQVARIGLNAPFKKRVSKSISVPGSNEPRDATDELQNSRSRESKIP